MRKFLLPVFIVVISSCQHQKQTAPKPLSEENVFNKDSVKLYLSGVDPQWADSSRKIFLQALDLFKNQQRAKASVSGFLTALQLFPDATAYYELGNACLASGDFKKALTSFQMAEKMGYAPLAHVLFKQACCYSELDDYDHAVEYMSYAVENGFVNRSEIFGKHMARYADYGNYIAEYNKAMAGNGNPEQLLWQSYLRSFPAIALPLQIDSGFFNRMKERGYISYDFESFIPQMRDNRFSRDVGNEYFSVGRLLANNQFHVLIYGCQSYENDGAPKSYFITIFDKAGKMVDKKMIAGAETFDNPFMECTLTSDLSLRISTFKNTWEKDVKEAGYESNRIVSREQLNTSYFTINNQGKIIAAAEMPATP